MTAAYLKLIKQAGHMINRAQHSQLPIFAQFSMASSVPFCRQYSPITFVWRARQKSKRLLVLQLWQSCNSAGWKLMLTISNYQCLSNQRISTTVHACNELRNKLSFSVLGVHFSWGRVSRWFCSAAPIFASFASTGGVWMSGWSAPISKAAVTARRTSQPPRGRRIFV